MKILSKNESLPLKNRNMLPMDIQSEKRHLIEQLTKLEDIGIIEQVKEVLKRYQAKTAVGSEPNGTVITQSDLITRAEASNQAIKEGRIISIEDLEEESKDW